MQDRLFDWFQELAPRITSVETAEDEFHKFAAEKNLSPALLERLGHMYNVKLAMHVHDTKAAPGMEFRVLNVPKILEDYTAYDPVKAAGEFQSLPMPEVGDDVHMDFPYGRMNFTDAPRPELEKAAGDDTPEPTYADELRESDRLDAWLGEAGIVDSMFERDLLEACKKAFDTLLDRYPGGLDDFERMEADAIAYSGGSLKSACDILAEWLETNTYSVKRAAEDTRKRIVWREDVLADELEAIKTAAEHLTAIREWIKEAAATRPRPSKTTTPWLSPYDGTQREIPPPPPPTSEDGRPEKPEKPDTPDKTDGKTEDVLLKLLSGVPSITTHARPAMENMFKSDPYETQRAMDRAMEDAKAQTVLETLMLTDPMIGTSDPEVVLSFAQSILEADPRAARDYNVMRFALREALAQSGFDTQSRQVLQESRKRTADTEKAEAQVADRRYGGGRAKDEKDD